MSTTVRFILAAALVVSALPAGAQAALSSGCTATYTSEGQCRFFLAGHFLTVHGDATGDYIDVHVGDATGTRWVFGCSAAPTSGTGGVRCEASFGTWVTPPAIEVPAGVPLTCRVEGEGSGTFGCYSMGG